MVHEWSIIELSFAKEIFLDYINGSENYDNKIIEIQSLSSVLDETGTRYFLDRYTDRKQYTKYDASRAFLKNMGLESVNREKALACLITLSEMKRTTPEPFIDQKFKDAATKMASSAEERRLMNKFLGKLEQATNCLVTKDPQYQFMPITDLDVWGRMWKFMILGEPMIEGSEGLLGGFWFTRDDSGKLKRPDSLKIPMSKRFIRIRSIDLDDYRKEVDQVLEGNTSSIDPGLTENDIISC